MNKEAIANGKVVNAKVAHGPEETTEEPIRFYMNSSLDLIIVD